ncbi:MAG: hypothetical protein K2L39_05245 [Muribaculaceae bacterium]|nr:hypothetical protein [Muribaculaceae bacterium]
MRHLPVFIIILLFLSLLCGSCRKGISRMPRLLQADSIMDSRPDSALSILQAIDTTTISTPADRALYLLLLTQAEYKIGIDETDSKNIKIAVDYYKNHTNDRRRALQSLFLLGRIHLNANQKEEAIPVLFEAEHIALEINDQFYLGLIYRDLSIIYGDILSFSEASLYAKKSISAFETADNNEFANYERCNYAKCLIGLRLYSDAITLLDTVAHDATLSQDTITFLEAQKTIPIAYMGLAHYSQALKAYQKLYPDLSTIPTEDLERLIICYANTGHGSIADSLQTVATNRNANKFAATHTVYADNGDFKGAYISLQQLLNHYDSTYRAISDQKVTQTVALYKDHQINIERIKRLNHIKLAFLGMVCVILAFLSIFIYYRYRQTKLRQHQHTLIFKLEILNSELTQRLKAQESGSERLKHIIKSRSEVLDKLCSDYYQLPDDKRNVKYTTLLEQTINSLKSTSNFTDKILTEIDSISDGLISNLKNLSTSISEVDLQLLAYIYVGFSTRSISLLIEEKIEVIYNRKSRLKTKISNLDYPRKNELLALLN